MNTNIESDYFLGVRVDRLNRIQALNILEDYIRDKKKNHPRSIYFTNAHSVFLSHQDHELMEAINHADLVLADGSGLKWGGRILNKPIVENLNGTDFTPLLLKEAEENGWSVYLLGSREEVIRKSYHRIQSTYPGLQIAGYHHGYLNAETERKIINEINRLRPEILLLGMGSPLQEKWIQTNRKKINVKIALAIGGFFDFVSGEFPRAPKWMRWMGIEWLYRFINDPSTKWRRVFIEIPLFIPLIYLTQRLPRNTK